MPGADFFKGREARAIAEKLQAEIVEGGRRRKHGCVKVRFEGQMVARYGLRNDKYASHGYIPDQLHISLREAIDLVNCPLSRDGYFEILRGKGLLP